MARTQIPLSTLNKTTGLVPTALPIDSLNLMQYRNTGREAVMVVTGSGGSVSLTFRSVPDPFNRIGDIAVTVPGSSVTFYGPFAPTNIWGDGASQMYVDPGAVSGTASIALVSL
jgi:hypothetical protein